MATILKQRLLRTGDLEFTATTATDVDQYLCVVDERISKVDMAELFVAVPGNPVPRGTIKQLGSGYLICDRVVCSQQPNQGYIWAVHVHWKEIEQDQSQDQSHPTPNGNSIDPEDWTPNWQRRTVIVWEPCYLATYRGGYLPGIADDFLSTFDPAPLANSALQPFANPPQERIRYQVWTLRWLRASLPATLEAAEGKVNSVDFTINTPYTKTWAAETALIDAVNITKHRWGNVNLIAIDVEVVVDPRGWEWELADVGTAARAAVGDPDGNGGTISGPLPPGDANLRVIRDRNKKAVQDPVYLDGDGQPLEAGEAPFYSRWFPLETVDFNTVGLIKDF